VPEQAQLRVEPGGGERQAASHQAFTYSCEPAQALERLERAIAGMKSARVVVHEANYWRAEFMSALLRLVDDV
jgi:uncharacterized protein (DUF1499 family)